MTNKSFLRGNESEIILFESTAQELKHLSLGSDHDFWSGGAQRVGFTWDYFNEHGPKSDDYKQKKDREKYKQWFIDHRQFFESTKLMDFWKKDNHQLVHKFREDFRIAHNHIAKRTMATPIEEE